MHRVKLVGLALLAVFALAAISSSAALAEESGLPSILPTPTTGSPATFTSEALGEAILKGAAEIKCVKLANSGSFTSQRLGTVKLTFTECTANGSKCKSKEATNAGEILAFADVHLVDLEIESKLELGLATIVLGEKAENATKSVIITCGVLKDEVKGTVIGLVAKFGKTEPVASLEKVTKESVLFKESGGKQAIKTCKLTKEFCEGKTYELLSSTGGAFSEGIEIVNDDITFANTIETHF